MKSIAKWLAAVGVVVLVFLTQGPQIDQDVSAQMRKPVTVTRIYTGADGLSHAEEIEMKMVGDGSGSEMMKVTGMQFRRSPANSFSDWHPGPRRQFVITLSGRGEVEVSGGKKVALQPGHINLIEDTTGKGHITRGVGTEDRVFLFLPLPD